MAYTQKLDGRRRAVSVGTVTAVHLAVGAAFVLGLAPNLFVEPDARGIGTTFVPPKHKPAPPLIEPANDPSVTTVTLSTRIPRVALPTTDRPTTVPTTDRPSLPVPTGPNVNGFEGAEWTAPPPPPVPVPKPLPKVEPVRLASGPSLRDIGFGDADYPDAARRAGEQGVTAVTLTVGASGRATACQVSRSSGFYSLDEAACRLVTKRSRFTPAKDLTGKTVERGLTLPITWRLPR